MGIYGKPSLLLRPVLLKIAIKRQSVRSFREQALFSSICSQQGGSLRGGILVSLTGSAIQLCDAKWIVNHLELWTATTVRTAQLGLIHLDLRTVDKFRCQPMHKRHLYVSRQIVVQFPSTYRFHWGGISSAKWPRMSDAGDHSCHDIDPQWEAGKHLYLSQ